MWRHFQVHYKQVDDREKLHVGIVRDLERQHAKKTANLHNLILQDELTKAYREAEARAEKNWKDKCQHFSQTTCFQVVWIRVRFERDQ